MRLAPSTARAGHPNQARQREAAAAQMRRDASALQLQEALAHKAVDDTQKALEAAESDGVDAATLSTARERVTRAAREERAKASQETGQTAVTVEAEEEDRRKKEGAAAKKAAAEKAAAEKAAAEKAAAEKAAAEKAAAEKAAAEKAAQQQTPAELEEETALWRQTLNEQWCEHEEEWRAASDAAAAAEVCGC